MNGEAKQNEYLHARFENLGVCLDERQEKQFLDYARLLAEWNEKINLTAITDFEGIVLKHFVDSCAPVMFPELKSFLPASSLIDVGTGAGFPGIPLKILFPELKLTLADSLAKRIRFLEVLCAELGLKDVECVHGRAEDLAKSPRFREAFSAATARAVAPLNVLAEYTLPFVKKEGLLIAYKSADIGEEAKDAEGALGILGGDKPKILRFTLPESELGRSLVLVKKKKATPAKYPRKAGTAAKDPL